MLYPPHIMGGAERSVALLSEAQLAAGHTVAAACTTPGDWRLEVRNGVNVYRMPHETDFWAEEWPQHSVLQRGVRRFKQQFNTRLEAHFLRVIDDFRPDVVHTHSLLDVSTRTWLAAETRGLPIYVLRANTLIQIEQFLTDLFNLSSEAPVHSGEMDNVREQTQQAIAAVLNGERWVDLPPGPSLVRRLQHEMARGAELTSHSYGKEPRRHVRIFRE